MKHKMLSVFDAKASAYISPFFLPQEAMAVRTFTDCVNDPNHAFGKNPADYTLFCLGEFDDFSGNLQINETPYNLGNGVIHLRAKPVSPQLDLVEEIEK
ncbi:nonstructural protein [Microviridae sp.]|nr:nonstructural protein [Microviridae sp.]